MKKLKDGWEIKTLGEIATISSGGTPSRKNESYWNGSIPWVTTAEVKFNTIVDTAEKITDLGLSNSSAKLFPIGTILMAMYGQGKTRGQVAKLGIKATTNQACAAIILKENYHVEFYYQYLMSKYDDIREMSNSGGQENLSASIVKSIAIPVPPLEEQIQIAETLSTWDKAIQTTEKLLENSRRQKKALMQKLLGKGEQIFRLEDLGSTFTGLSGKSKVDFGKGKPYIPYMNIFTNSHIDIQHLELVEIGKDETQNKVRYGDIFFTTSSETPDEVGMSSVLLNEVDELYLNSFCFGFRLNNFENLLPEYAQYLFRCDEIRKAISLLGQGATRYNLSKTQLMKLTIKLPSLEEQREIAEILSTADQEIETLQRKLECLKLEKGALMQRFL
ncbi:restriction endonuclease subunit S [Actinobacillus porcitonsillarum]|uniref:Restriction endonuclease subunit S n=1 Tax=Actinobacillus porcitonsillarum TaxID=189834 RepID=A0A2U8FHS6_9PAST|nr:restriction endonuclease subunit S [Actinobacillus porcitonsillarum]AWI50512.1 restriction endonuclease subunit S [Actinobacillus porcitonsillarum]